MRISITYIPKVNIVNIVIPRTKPTLKGVVMTAIMKMMKISTISHVQMSLMRPMNRSIINLEIIRLMHFNFLMMKLKNGSQNAKITTFIAKYIKGLELVRIKRASTTKHSIRVETHRPRVKRPPKRTEKKYLS